MPETAITALLRAMLATGAELPSLPSRDRSLILRDFVCAAVDELRGEGWTSAHVAMELHTLAQKAGIGPDEREIMDDLTAWCIQRYYAPAIRKRA